MEGGNAAGSTSGRSNPEEKERPVLRRSARLRKNVPSVTTTKTSSSVARAREADLLAKREAVALEEKIDHARREVELLEHEVKTLMDQLQEVKVREVTGPEEKEARRLEVRALETSIRTKANDAEAKRINLKYLGKSIERKKELLEDQREVTRLLLEEDEEGNSSQDLSGEDVSGDEDEYKSVLAVSEGARSSSPNMEEILRRLRKLRGEETPPIVTPPVDPLVTLCQPTTQWSPPPPEPPVTLWNPPAQPTTTQVAVQEATNSAVSTLTAALTEAFKNVAAGGKDKEAKTEKFIARQAIKIDLSPFDGNPEEWPIFYNQYRSVSDACALSPVENLQRLQRALKGEARQCVRALLMSPDNVNEILSVLKKRFGNPRLVVQRLVEQAQALTTIREGDHGGFLQFVDVVRNLATTADAMKCEAFLANPQLITQLVKKLPPVIQLEWAKHQGTIDKPFPDLTDVAKWLETTAEYVMRLYEPNSSSTTTKATPAHRPLKPQKSYAASDATKKTEKSCRACGRESHHLSKCPKFEGWTVEERWKWVRVNRYCFSCLNYGHSVSECRGKRDCGQSGCNKPHHRKLHLEPQIDVVLPDPPSLRTETLGHAVAADHINLNIIPVILKGPRGCVETFAMLDPGATLTVLDSRVADRLGLTGPNKPLTHSGLHEAVTVSDSRSVQVSVSGRGGEEYILQNVRTMSKLTLPKQSVKRSTLQRWSHLKKLPITFYNNARPDILIGQDNAHLCNTSELVLGPANAPAAGRTKLGWVLMGRVGASPEQNLSFHLREETEDDLHQLVKYHSPTEAFGVKPNVERPRSREDGRAEEIMRNSLKRVGDRRESGLLWKSDDLQLPSKSKEAAYRRLLSMERKTDSSPEFAAAYAEKIEEYLQKGYARKLTSEEAAGISPKTFYLPHFMEINPKKGNKLRFVFDAAANTSGRSLNDCLVAGPDLINSLPSVLSKFRQKAIAVTVDVRDKFHRVGVKKKDPSAQRFLWREMDRKIELETYQMNFDQWGWISTNLNVADEVTCDGCDCNRSPESRLESGPKFLLEDEDKWPKEQKTEPVDIACLELKREFVGAAVESSSSVLPLENYSSWTRLIRATGWLMKFCKWIRKLPTHKFLTPEDIVAAENVWWRQVQEDCYGKELRSVRLGRSLPLESKVSHLNLFLDNHGVLRLHGRLSKAALEESTKCPVLLDSKHPYTRLLMSHYHEDGGHHGQERVVNEVRQRFYMPHLRPAVKSTWTRCQRCKNARKVPQPPLMGQLPAYRLEAGVFPFANSGVDYFGPFEVTIGRRHEKRWVALFTCLSTRAVHLEVAGSLSTDSCIMAVRRFVGRRGCPKNLFSDNGTNFHGANNELRKALRDLDQQRIVAACSKKSIKWHFNPPSAPHMGGSWERLVKSVKVALYATLREQAPREEVLHTLLVEAEHSVNSHPLTHVSIDPEDPEALTPNHFLIGRSSNVAPPGIFEKGDLCNRKTWRKSQRLADQFWKRWVKEYLPTLQRRTKWQKMTKPIEVDDVAVEVDPQQPRNKWTLGRVAAVYPGEDGVTRVVDWKTTAGTYRRPVAKLAFLEVKKEEDSSPELKVWKPVPN